MGRLGGRDSPQDSVRVLLVEDHPVVREVISRPLGDFDAAVTATAGVAEALEAFVSPVEHRRRVLRAGFQYYVAKPVDARRLVSVVTTLAARSVAVGKNAARAPGYPRSERGSRPATTRSAG
jgi:CheY-like chemotaxis protein